MKARVIATGDIVDVIVKEIPQYGFQGENSAKTIEYFITKFYDGENYYRYGELDFEVEPFDYWTRLEHQYAGMAMQGILSNPDVDLDYKSDETMPQAVAETAYKIAHALVEKLKSENNG